MFQCHLAALAFERLTPQYLAMSTHVFYFTDFLLIWLMWRWLCETFYFMKVYVYCDCHMCVRMDTMQAIIYFLHVEL